MDIKEILSKVDHTMLRQECSSMDIKQLCDEGLKYGVASVCIPPVHVSGAKRYLNGRLKICTVVGFPNGYSTTRVKTYEAADAIKSGADEVDMVINIGMVKDGCWNDVYDEIRQVRAAVPADKILKVIIETCLLTEEEKMTLCEIVSATGANYIKTSTGFSTGGATAEDVALMRRYCSPRVKIKAAGGINTFEEAQALIDLGADRIGSSRLVKLAAALEE